MSVKAPFKVIAFSHDNLVKLIDSLSAQNFPGRTQATNPHLKYLSEYLSALGAKTIVLECDYIDHDYLEDYAGYYVRCFNPYGRTTARLHFFDISFDEKQFKNVILKSPNGRLGQKLNPSYLGFMVIKPLPQTIVGRTCFKTYGDDGNRRHFPTLHKYSANLFGIPLTVESLAYQEQDKVVAACATSALWSLFHGSGKIFHHHIPSPVEITKAATIHIPDTGSVPHDARSIHHSGLTPTQMAHSIRAVGMEPHLEGVKESVFGNKNTIYAYLKARIPVLLCFSLTEENVSGAPIKEKGNHAAAIAGYSLGLQDYEPHGDTGILTVASKIDRIYVHDDQVGPFAKMVFTTTKKLNTNWLDEKGDQGKIFAYPFCQLIPLYHKIRIPFGIIFKKIADFDAIIEIMRPNIDLNLSQRLVWDIYLTNINEIKNDVINSRLLDTEAKRNILFINMPKYLWRATALENGEKKIDVLFDATDIEQGAILITVITYDSELRKQLLRLTPIVKQVVPLIPELSETVFLIFERIANPRIPNVN